MTVEQPSTRFDSKSRFTLQHNNKQHKKSQNCVKAAIAFVCTSGKEKTFVCTIAIDNFCLQYYNLQFFYALLQILTFACNIAIANNFVENYTIALLQ